jgi:hypothetical protein
MSIQQRNEINSKSNSFEIYPRNLMVATPRKKRVTEMHPMMV